MRSSSTRRACGSRQTCGKRQERVSHKVFGRAQNARPHAPQAVRFSLTEDQAKTPGGFTCVRGDVARYCQPSPEWPVFKRSSVATFQRSVTARHRGRSDAARSSSTTRCLGAVAAAVSVWRGRTHAAGTTTVAAHRARELFVGNPSGDLPEGFLVALQNLAAEVLKHLPRNSYLEHIDMLRVHIDSKFSGAFT